MPSGSDDITVESVVRRGVVVADTSTGRYGRDDCDGGGYAGGDGSDAVSAGAVACVSCDTHSVFVAIDVGVAASVADNGGAWV